MPPTVVQDVDQATLLFALHGLHGTAGNLGLNAISELAGELEALARAGRFDQVRPRIPDLIAQLQVAHEAVFAVELEASLATEAAEPASPTGCTDSPSHPTDPITAMTGLLAVLERNELDDDLLTEVCAALTQQDAPAQACTLREAIDAFDFNGARNLLREWLATPERAVAQ